MRAPRFWARWTRPIRRKARAIALRALQRVTGARAELRQFVYLDEVALRSLMAARYGAEEVKLIESSTRGREIELSADADQGVPGVASAKAGGRYQTSSSRSRQVERQTTIQSIFKEFLQREEQHASLVWNALEEAEHHADPFSLARGDLIQVRVRLSADPVYRVGAFIAEYSDMLQNMPGGDQIDARDAQALSGMLERLMVGQVPIRALVIDFEGVSGLFTIQGVGGA